MLDKHLLKCILEGALLAYNEPLSIARMQQLFPEHEQPDAELLRETLAELAQDYDNRGIYLKEVASGFRFQTDEKISPWLAKLWEEKPARYSRAFLETLVLIAYRQPVTRGEIEDVRGVTVNTNIIKSLLEREWIRVVGHREVPGRPSLYATTRQFLDYFNLKSLDELPNLEQIQDLDENQENWVRQLELELALDSPNSSTEVNMDEQELTQVE